MPPGRNDPCPCGSGKKYKKCCLPREAEAVVVESGWLRMRRGQTTERIEGEEIGRFHLPGCTHDGNRSPHI